MTNRKLLRGTPGTFTLPGVGEHSDEEPISERGRDIRHLNDLLRRMKAVADTVGVRKVSRREIKAMEREYITRDWLVELRAAFPVAR